MNSSYKPIIYCVILLAFFNLQYTEGQEHLLISTDTDYNGILKDDDNQYYKFVVPYKKEYNNLIILAEGLDPQSDPDIYISIKNTHPKDGETSDYQCSSFGLDICPIPKDQVYAAQVFYIGIHCNLACSYKMRAYYQSEHYMVLGDQLTISFTNISKSEIVVFKLPKKIMDEQFKKIFIEADLMNPYTIQKSFLFFMQSGNVIPSSSDYKYKGEEIWSGGQGIQISKQDLIDDFQDDYQNYTILFEAEAGTLIKLKSRLVGSSESQDVQIYQIYNDLLEYDESTSYKLNLSSAIEEDLIFELQPFTGNPNLYIHPNNKPEKPQQSYWKMENYGDVQIIGKKRLVITKKEILQYNNPKLFYITIESSWTYSSYSFTVYPRAKMDLLMIDFGTPVMGKVLNDEIINYKLIVYGNSYMDQQKFNITIDLLTDSGNPDLIIRRCSSLVDLKNCLINQDDITKINEIVNKVNDNSNVPQSFYDQNKQLIMWSMQLGSKDTIVIEHDPSYCQTKQSDPQLSSTCIYMIAVLGNDAIFKQDSTYTLLVQHNFQHSILREGEILRDYLAEGEKSYYKFSLHDPPENITQVKILITVISGEVMAYASQTVQEPDADHFDQADSFFGQIEFNRESYDDINDKVILDLNGTYYLGLEANAESYFTITVIVVRKSKNNIDIASFVKLYQDVQQEVFLKEKEFFYFYIQVPDKTDVFLRVFPLQGQFNFFVTTKQSQDNPPSETNYIWRNEGYHWRRRFIIIPQQDEQFSQTGYFFGAVTPDPQDNSEFQQYQFRIVYHTTSGIHTIKPNDQLQDFIRVNETKQFKLEVKEGEIYVLQVNPESYSYDDKIKLYYTYRQRMFFPNSYRNDGTLSGRQKSEYLNGSSIKESQCNWQDGQFPENPQFKIPPIKIEGCFIYITVEAEKEMTFQLKAIMTQSPSQNNTEVSPIQLFDQQEQTEHIPKKNNYKRFYFMLPPGRTVTIFEYSLAAKMNIYANILPLSYSLTNSSNVTKIENYPNSDNYQFVSINTHSVTFNKLTITKQDLDQRNCFNGEKSSTSAMNKPCVLLLSLTPDTLIEDIQIEKEHFQITVTAQELIQLQERVPIMDVIGEKGMKYYSLYVTDPDTNILVSLTSIGDMGDADLVISKGIDSRPTLDDANWVSQNPNVDYIQISMGNRGNKTPIANTTGYYVVGVYGFHKSQYSLAYTTGNFSILTAFANTPIDIALKKLGQAMYLTYYHYSHESFSIQLSKVTGSAEIAVTLMPIRKSNDTSNDFIRQLPHPTKRPQTANGTYIISYWSNHYQGNQDSLLIDSSNQGFCTYCEYIIGIYATKPQTVLSATIQIEGHYSLLQTNKLQQDFATIKKSNYYHYYAQKNFTLIINVLQGSIDVYVQNGYTVSQDNYQQKDSCNQSQKSIEMKIKVNETNIQTDSKEYYNKTNDLFKLNAFSIMVYGLKNVNNYTIILVPEDQARKISLGHPVQGTINQQIQSIKYSYYSNGQSGDERDLQVILQFEGSNQKPEIQLFYKNVLINPSLYTQFQYKNSIQCHIYNIFEGQYTIIVQLNPVYSHYEEINYSLLVNSMNIVQMNSEQPIYRTSYVGLVDKYQIFVNKASKILVEVSECNGKVDVLINRNYEKFVSGTYEYQLSQQTTSHLIGTVKINPNDEGVVYFAVKPRRSSLPIPTRYPGPVNTTFQYVYYQMNIKIYPYNTELPYEKFQPGLSGMLQWKRDFQTKTMIINWQGLECEDYDSSVFVILSIQYNIIMAQDLSTLEEFARCNGEKNQNNSIIPEIQNQQIFFQKVLTYTKPIIQGQAVELKMTVEESQIPNNSEQLYLTIIATAEIQDKKTDQKEDFQFFYNPTPINNYYQLKNLEMENDEKGISTSWIIFGIISLSLLGLLLCVVFQRYKKIEKRLNYEMADVRNVARLDEPYSVDLSSQKQAPNLIDNQNKV